MAAYLVNQKDSNISFAGIIATTNDEVKEKTALAVKEEFCYESVIVREIKEVNAIVFVVCQCATDEGDLEIKKIELHLTAIY